MVVVVVANEIHAKRGNRQGLTMMRSGFTSSPEWISSRGVSGALIVKLNFQGKSVVVYTEKQTRPRIPAKAA